MNEERVFNRTAGVSDSRLKFLTGSILSVLFVVGCLFFFYYLGSSEDWMPRDWHPQVEGGPSVEKAAVSPEGDWLVWKNTTDGSVCAYDLRHGGRVACLDPGPCAGVIPLGVLDGDLLVLRSRFEGSVFKRIGRGLLRFFTGKRFIETDIEDLRVETHRRTTYLERVGLDSGTVEDQIPGLTFEPGFDGAGVTDFEMGAVSLSPQGNRLAWWKAAETIGETPLSATITEEMEVFSTRERFKKIMEEKVVSKGNVSFRTALLHEMGRPFWWDSNTCCFLSFLDGGSLVPFDCSTEEVLATIPLEQISKIVKEENSHILYGPEGVSGLYDVSGERKKLVAWARDQDSVFFFLFDDRLDAEGKTAISLQSVDTSRTVWLRFSHRLLVEDTNRNRLVALSPTGAKSRHYPLPPDWEDVFQLVGEDKEGELIGTNKTVFLRTKSGMSDWETLDLY